MEEVFNLIANYGFPIGMCLILFWYMNKTQEQHKEEIDKMREAINNNTLVIQQLVDKLKD